MKQTRWNALLLGVGLLASLVLSACGGGGSSAAPAPAPPPPPFTYTPPADLADGWSVGSAADVGFDVTMLEDMVDDVRSGLFPNVDAIAVAKDGVFVFDETFRTTTDGRDAWVGNTDPDLHILFSASKSITSLIVGIAIDEGHIANVDVPFLDLFSYPAYANWDPRKDDISLHHVLAMQTGLDWDEFDPPYSSADNQWNRFINTETDFAKAFLDLPVAADPGTVFAYSSAASATLGQAVENAAPMTLVDFALSELFLPLDISRVELLRTPTGLPNGGNGVYLTARDAAKFGELVLNDGTWNGDRIVSANWLAESMTPRTAVSFPDPGAWDWTLEGYGYQWWTGAYDIDGQRYDTYAAWGYGSQWILAVPALDLAIAIHGSAYDGSDEEINEAHALVKHYIFAALDL